MIIINVRIVACRQFTLSFCVLSKDSRELAYDVLGELGFSRG